ncbi:MAG: RsmB/NOP family class I SAM-dependent RNA methyltransferase [Reyranellaceae bacterium]
MSENPLQSRRVALDVYAAAGRGGRSLDDALREHKGFARLAPRDRAFVRNLVATAFRHRGQIEALLAGFVSRPLPQSEALIADIVHLGLAQLLFLETPPHAAVDTSVRLAETSERARMKGFVNAVLRRAGREGAAVVARQDAARLNTPDWLWRSWVQAYGPAQAHDIAAAHLKEAALDISVKADPEKWARDLNAIVLPTGSLRRLLVSPPPLRGRARVGGDQQEAPPALTPLPNPPPQGGRESESRLISELPGFAEGAWWVQDAAAALPARLLGEVTGRSVADLCCAPGGKTLQLAAAGAEVTAVDVSAARLKLVQDNLARTGLVAQTIAADVLTWKPGRQFDAVLLDAPCTATGTLRRHPDAAWHKRATDVARLAQLQAHLLDAAAALVRPGGTLVYAVCSLQPEEGARQIEAMLARHGGFAPAPVAAGELPGLEAAIAAEGWVRTLPCQWPERGGLDGFFIARLRRN